MKKIIITLAAISSAVLLSSCGASKDLAYFNNVGATVDAEVTQQITQNYNHKIQKDDELSITITSKSPELVIPFTQVATPSATAIATNADAATTNTSTEQQGQVTYRVSASGNINFPILGKIHAEGLTYEGLATTIEKKLIDGGYINDPSVTVELKNFKITVIGEVKTPGVQEIKGNRVSIFDALAMAGDLTEYGIRNDVSIVKENNGQRTIAKVNLNDQSILTSPYYYLQPNDTVYVKPSGVKEWQGEGGAVATSTGFSFLAMIVALFSLTD